MNHRHQLPKFRHRCYIRNHRHHRHRSILLHRLRHWCSIAHLIRKTPQHHLFGCYRHFLLRRRKYLTRYLRYLLLRIAYLPNHRLHSFHFATQLPLNPLSPPQHRLFRRLNYRLRHPQSSIPFRLNTSKSWKSMSLRRRYPLMNNSNRHILPTHHQSYIRYMNRYYNNRSFPLLDLR